MSSRIDDRSGRNKDRPSTREVEYRSRGNNGRGPSPPSTAGYGRSATKGMPGAFDDGDSDEDDRAPTYEVRAPAGATTTKRSSYYGPPTTSAGTKSASSVPYPQEFFGAKQTGPPNSRPGYGPPAALYPSMPDMGSDSDDDLAYGDVGGAARKPSAPSNYQSSYPGQRPGDRYMPQPDRDDPRAPRSIPYGNPSPPDRDDRRSSKPYTYTPAADSDDRRNSRSYSYAVPPEKITYTKQPQAAGAVVQYRPSEPGPRDQLHRTYTDSDHHRNGAQIVEIAPGQEGRTSATNRTRHMSLNAPPPGFPADPRMDMLSVGGLRPEHHGNGAGGGMPPPSPMLEAYRGTWQSVSPMAMAIRPNDESDLSDLEPLDGLTSRSSKKGYNDKLSRDADSQREKDRGKDRSSKSKDKDKEKSKSRDQAKDERTEKKHVTVYNAEEDAKKLKSALNHSKTDNEAIIDVLPSLSHDQVWDLRKEYKKQVKIQGKGINLPKHLKMKLSGNFGKVVYVTALGRWESEGYWANFWYQSHGSRRELLIESLMGRTNAEIRYIKDEFRDKRYSDSLTKCMEKELKMDKFRSAVLMVLEERRQDEQDVYPVEYRQRDVDVLQRTLTARQGGETAMLDIILRRSDAHLREVLRLYQAVHGENFARVALQRSNNLVGEVIAHILNGVINKPARDAILLNHAIRDVAAHNKEDDLRYELLISRLVRYHWDRLHLARVKKEYREKYGVHLQEDIEGATKGDFREFMCELCET